MKLSKIFMACLVATTASFVVAVPKTKPNQKVVKAEKQQQIKPQKQPPGGKPPSTDGAMPPGKPLPPGAPKPPGGS